MNLGVPTVNTVMVLRTAGLLILTALGLGLAVTDLLDDPHATHAFLDAGPVRSLVDGQWPVFLVAALLAYAVRLGIQRGAPPPWPYTRRWLTLVELAGVAALTGLTALGLSWLSVWYIPCVLESRCE